MSIKRTIVICLLLSFVIPTFLVGKVFISKILENFEAVEVRVMEQQVSKLRQDYDRQLNQLAATARDWGQWDDASNFVKNPKDQEMRSWLFEYESFQNIGVSIVAYLNKEGSVVFAAYRDDESKKIVESQKEQNIEIERSIHDFLPGVSPKSERTGALIIGKSSYVFAAVPVFPSNLTGSARGFIILAQKLDDQLWKNLAKGSSLTVEINLSPLSNPNTQGAVSVSSDALVSAFQLSDPNGAALFSITAKSSRELFLDALSKRNDYIYFLQFFSLIAVALSYMLIHALVVKKLDQLENDARDIAQNLNLSSRINIKGSSEVKSLANSLNIMLEKLELSNHEIVMAKSRAEQADRAKTSFISKINHELRTPIFTVLGNIRFLKKEKLPPRAVERVGMIEESSEGLLNIVNDVLDFTELSCSNAPLIRESFNLRQILLELMASQARLFRKKDDVLIKVLFNGKLPESIYSDERRLRLLLSHLVSNAIKFTDKGLVQLSFERRGTSLLFTVRDTGLGMERAQLERLKEPFSQLEETSNRRFDGLGLGLALVKRTVASFGGEIEFDGALGIGTTVKVLLPNTFEDSSSDDNREQVVEVYSSDAQKKSNEVKNHLHVLVAEDVPLNRILIKGMLEDAGHTVVCVNDGLEMVNAIKEMLNQPDPLKHKPFDLVLADLEMPNCGGIEAIRLARQVEKNSGRNEQQRLPIVILTAHVSSEHEQLTKDVGGDGFLLKPIEPEQLRQLSERIIKNDGK